MPTSRPFDPAEYDRVAGFMGDFFTRCYTDRDYKAVGEMAADNILCVVLGPEETGTGRDVFERFLRIQMEEVSTPVPYTVTHYEQTYCGDHRWNCFAKIELSVVSASWGTAHYLIRLTSSVRADDDGILMDLIHVSESGSIRKKFSPAAVSDTQMLVQREIGRIISEVVPGGIVSRFAAEGSPVSIANEQFLRMTGYSSIHDYLASCSGLFLNSVHPDDVERYLYSERFISTTGKQLETEYRIRRSDNTYLWVHDTGRKTVSVDGRDLIISVMNDMSEQIERQRKLEFESETDELTSVYNRKGAMHRFKNWERPYERYVFFIIDLDHFKKVNDLYGHMTGDRMLIYTARRLQEKFGDIGLVCRLGGDEFAVFLPDYPGLDKVLDSMYEIAQDYQHYLAQQCPEAGSTLSMGGVYGGVITNPDPVYIAADANLYKIKYTDTTLHLSEMK